jgi:transposase-like protein
MKKSRYTEEQILFALKQADAGQAIADVCRQMGISEATFYVWKKHEALAIEHAQQPILLNTRECQRGPWPHSRYGLPDRWAVSG